MPVLFNQGALNDFVRDLDLAKLSAELLANELSKRKMLTQDTKVSFYREREKSFLKYFSAENKFVFCHDVKGLLNALGYQYISIEWRLFVDSSNISLKCVLLSNGQKYAVKHLLI